MNALFFFVGGMVAVVGFGLLLKKLSKRKTAALATPENVASLRQRLTELQVRADNKPVLIMLKLAEDFVQRASTALEFDQFMRARLHINLVAMVLSWAETALDVSGADTPRMTTTNQLSLGLALLTNNRFDLALEEFEKVWLDQYAHVNAKRVSVMGSLWIHASRGQHQEAAEDEQLLLMLPHVVAMEGVDVTMSVAK